MVCSAAPGQSGGIITEKLLLVRIRLAIVTGVHVAVATVVIVHLRRMLRVVVTIMVQRHAIEFLKGVNDEFATRSRKPTVQRYALEVWQRTRAANIDALALLDRPKVECVHARIYLGRNWWFLMSDERPLCSLEEWMGLDVRSARSGSETPILVLGEQLPNQVFAESVYTCTMLVRTKGQHQKVWSQ